MENKKNPKATNANLKARAVNGSLLSMIGLVVIKAEDHSNIKKNGKILNIFPYSLITFIISRIILNLN